MDEAVQYMQDRELSWLSFNERVLDEASDTTVPALERFKFISIFISNLDEFFMIRVGSIYDLISIGQDGKDKRSGLTAQEELDAIYKKVGELYKKKTKVYNDMKENIKQFGIFPLDINQLTDEEKKYVKTYFKQNIKPILSPQIVDKHHPFPHISNKEIYVSCLLQGKNENILGLIPVPQAIGDIIILPGDDIRYIRSEKLIYEYVEDVFTKYSVLDKNCFCVTRNSDLHPEDEPISEEEDFKGLMKKVLKKRKRLGVVRVEANYKLSKEMENIFCDRFNVKKHQIYISDTAMTMNYVYTLMSKVKPSEAVNVLDTPYEAKLTSQLDHNISLIKQIEKKDVLMHYPYESMDTFLQLINEASENKNVISIKITIYRLASQAKLVEYLCKAAENGIEVTTLMELRARFDEQNNIDWSEKLEKAGCKVLYGLDEFKVHSKVCLITIKDKNSFKYITQVGTGNYNEKTAKLYTDLSLLTANYNIGRDASEFFKNIGIKNIEGRSDELLVAPQNLKNRLIAKIRDERLKGDKGRIIFKMNSLTDIDFINALVKASKQGVKISLIIRGICCILPGIKGMTENIEVISIVGRYLEHPRIYSFGLGDEQSIYISSADLMTRNTQRRIEVACPILDTDLKAEMNHILDIMLRDNVKARRLLPSGKYVKREGGIEKINSQEYFMDYYTKKNSYRPILKSNVPVSSKISRIIKILFE